MMMFMDLPLTMIQEVLYPGLRPQKPLPTKQEKSEYVALVSGLAVGDPSGNPSQISLLVDYLTGMLGSSTEQTMTSQASLNPLFVIYRLRAIQRVQICLIS